MLFEVLEMKNGWSLLALSFVCGLIAFFVFITFGDGIGGGVLGEYLGQIGAIIGFLSPSIVYFGNRA